MCFRILVTFLVPHLRNRDINSPNALRVDSVQVPIPLVRIALISCPRCSRLQLHGPSHGFDLTLAAPRSFQIKFNFTTLTRRFWQIVNHTLDRHAQANLKFTDGFPGAHTPFWSRSRSLLVIAPNLLSTQPY